MTEDKKLNEEDKLSIGTQYKGLYTIFYKEKNYIFMFPIDGTLEDCKELFEKMVETIQIAIDEKNKKIEEDKKNEKKEEYKKVD